MKNKTAINKNRETIISVSKITDDIIDVSLRTFKTENEEYLINRQELIMTPNTANILISLLKKIIKGLT